MPYSSCFIYLLEYSMVLLPCLFNYTVHWITVDRRRGSTNSCSGHGEVRTRRPPLLLFCTTVGWRYNWPGRHTDRARAGLVCLIQCTSTISSYPIRSFSYVIQLTSFYASCLTSSIASCSCPGVIHRIFSFSESDLYERICMNFIVWLLFYLWFLKIFVRRWILFTFWFIFC